MIIVVVGFKVSEPNSTFYKKFEVPGLDTGISRDRIAAVMAQALKVSDFISVRRIG